MCHFFAENEKTGNYEESSIQRICEVLRKTSSRLQISLFVNSSRIRITQSFQQFGFDGCLKVDKRPEQKKIASSKVSTNCEL